MKDSFLLVAGICIGLILGAFLGNASAENSVVTEIETYKLKCTEIDSNLCISYSVMKINKE